MYRDHGPLCGLEPSPKPTSTQFLFVRGREKYQSTRPFAPVGRVHRHEVAPLTTILSVVFFFLASHGFGLPIAGLAALSRNRKVP
jgi:hypothetical protein